MLNKLFPEKIDNQYEELLIARWLFYVITLLSLGRSLAHILLPDGGAQLIATIPLNAFPVDASKVIIGMFAQWGLIQLMVGLLYVISLWRYQSLIPLMWVFVLFEYLGRLLLTVHKPFETSGTAPGAIGNIIIPFLALIMLIMLISSLKQRKKN